MRSILCWLFAAGTTLAQLSLDTGHQGLHEVEVVRILESRSTSSESQIITSAPSMQASIALGFDATPASNSDRPSQDTTVIRVSESTDSADAVSQSNATIGELSQSAEGHINAQDCTVNAMAGLVWWYPAALYNVIGSMTTMKGANTTLYSLMPMTSTFDIKEALESALETMSYGESMDTISNTTTYFASLLTLDPPQAASTVSITVNSVMSIPTGTFGPKPRGGWFVEAPDPTFVVSDAGEPQLTGAPYDPILYLTQIEIVSLKSQNPSIRPARSTTTQKLTAPLAITFPAESSSDLGSVATQSGALDGKFMDQNFPAYSACAPGTWSAPQPTMIIIVVVTIDSDSEWEMQLVHAEKPAIIVDGPDPENTPIKTTPISELTETPQQAVTTSPPDNSVNIMTLTSDVQGPGPSLDDRLLTLASSNLGFVLGSKTLAPGGTITISDSIVIYFENGASPTVVNINRSPQTLGSITQPPSIFVSGTAIPQRSDGAFLVGDQTLRPGQSIVVAGNTVSLGIGAYSTEIVFNGVTSSLSAITLPVLIISGTTYTATSILGGYVIASRTLTPGGSAITLSGTTYSLPPGAPAVVINGKTLTPDPTNGTTSRPSAASTQTFTAGSNKGVASKMLPRSSSLILFLLSKCIMAVMV